MSALTVITTTENKWPVQQRRTNTYIFRLISGTQKGFYFAPVLANNDEGLAVLSEFGRVKVFEFLPNCLDYIIGVN